MIIAQVISGGADNVQAQFLFEGGKQISTLIFKNTDQVQRKVDVLNRDYLVSILKKWLSQRSHALGNSRNREYPMFLWQIVDGYKLASFIELIKVLRLYKEDFMKCVPGQDRSTYKHYEKEIKPWLQCCYGLTGG